MVLRLLPCGTWGNLWMSAAQVACSKASNCGCTRVTGIILREKGHPHSLQTKSAKMWQTCEEQKNTMPSVGSFTNPGESERKQTIQKMHKNANFEWQKSGFFNTENVDVDQGTWRWKFWPATGQSPPVGPNLRPTAALDLGPGKWTAAPGATETPTDQVHAFGYDFGLCKNLSEGNALNDAKNGLQYTNLQVANKNAQRIWAVCDSVGRCQDAGSESKSSRSGPMVLRHTQQKQR